MHGIRRSIVTAMILLFEIALSGLCYADCVPRNLATPPPKDPVVRVLAAQNECPRNAIEFVETLARAGVRLEPTIVNFVGFNNPGPGAFFMFEIASNPGTPSTPLIISRGDLLFGHFTTATDGNQLVSVQQGLSVELIAWDPDKQFYNFYEVVNDTWFYRGDSKDILDDVQFLHRQRSASAAPFGARLRCSGCHVNGGLLQKELAPPHNDWSTQARPLALGALRPDAFVRGRLAAAVDADELTKLVSESTRRLANSPTYRRLLASRGMQERLRPLFCPMEINIESDAQPFDDRLPALRIPSAFFIDPRLGTVDISISRQHYETALQRLRSRLPSSSARVDADHGWLTPVKALSDIAAIDALIEQGVVDTEFVADVLAVDLTNPVFSKTRCGLLKLAPDTGGPDFVARFQDRLRAASQSGASELLKNLSDATRDAAFHQRQAAAYLASCRERATNPDAVVDWLRLLSQRRVEVAASEISQNPRGHILEDPGRVVFPSTAPQAAAGLLTLTPACLVQ